MEQLKKATYANNTPIIVPSKAVGLKHEHEMVVGCEFNHTFLQDKLMSCKLVKHIGSFSVIFMILSLLMFSTWMIVDSIRCERVRMANNMISVFMFIMQMIVMQ
jgi:ABC-type Na+ efflux pump permease subunit